MLRSRKISKSMRLFVLSAAMLAASCSNSSKVLYSSDNFTLSADRVEQGKYKAIASSATKISSNYQSTASSIYPRHVSFKFSINEKDIEMPSGKNHEITVGTESQSPVIKFGEQFISNDSTKELYLPANYKYTFRVDFSEVIAQFNTNGFYTAHNGSKIAKSDFKGFYIAGDAFPLSWDFVNLDENKLKLSDPDGDNIYEITLTLNPLDKSAAKTKKWRLSRDISAKPAYASDQKIVDALYNLSVEEALINIEPDSTFRTGAKWGGVWTRDISYSILLAFAYHQPDVAKISLMKKVRRGRIIQDTGSGGAWPVSSDRTTWALAAWEVYKTTGDLKWLENSFKIIKNSLDDDYLTLFDKTTGMFRGESSFLDWREQTYPKWMQNADIYSSENLGTNAVHFQAHNILIAMGKILKKDVSMYQSRADNIKKGINQYLWNAEKGYYSQYLYGRTNLNQSVRFEALGEALSILFEIADTERAAQIIASSPITDFGTTCIYPQIPEIPPYHNNAVWPFVQAYWNLAAAKAGNETVLNHGLASIYRPGGLFLTNYENFVADNGDYVGTEINSDRMLWSMAGNLAMVHRVFMGMEFSENGILFSPSIPKNYGGTKTLTNFKYRNATLTISVAGHGNEIAEFFIDGKLAQPYFDGALTGKHSILIKMKNNDFSGKMNLVPNHFTTPAPQMRVDGNFLRWNAVAGATSYNIYKNGVLANNSATLVYPYEPLPSTEYKISAVDDKGYESFMNEPILAFTPENIQIVEIEDFAFKSDLGYINFSGKGFVPLTRDKNHEIVLRINAPTEGNYLIDFRYSNGNGPWNTDNKCAIRSLFVNKEYYGVIVLPQRGTGEWSDWGYSNSHTIKLTGGENTIRITFEDWNNNMNVDENTAMIDFCRLIKLN